MARARMAATHKPTSESAEPAQSSRGIRSFDPDELVALVDLLREGDRVRVNGRKQAITVEAVEDRPHQRRVALSGHGTHYDITLNRDDGELVLRVGGGTPEPVTDLRTTNRNPRHVDEYDRLLDEEIETVAVGHYLDRIRQIDRRNPTLDLSRRQYRGEWRFEGGDVTALKWAVSGYLDTVAARYFSGGNEYQRAIWDDARTLWERVRETEETFVAFGDEMGKIGAVFDYAVEDPSIQLPADVAAGVEALRDNEPAAMLPDAPWPETVPRL